MTAPYSIATTEAAVPFDLMAEQALIGALLIQNALVAPVSLVLDEQHFYEQIHRLIYGAIVETATAGRPADAFTIGAILSTVELPPGAPPLRQYLARLMAEAVMVRDAVGWAVMIRDLAHRREIIEAANDLSARSRQAKITTAGADLIDGFSEATKHILDANAKLNVEPTADMAWRIVDEIEKSSAGQFHREAFTTGFDRLDELTLYRPEEVIVTAGRPGQGKSVLAACAARRTAEGGLGVLFFPLEIGREQALARFISDIAYDERSPVMFSRILNRDLHSLEHRDRVGAAARFFTGLPITVDDAERITIARLAAKVKYEKAKMAARGLRLGVVFLDHLDFIEASDRYAGQRVQEIGEIMIGLKAIARREKVVIHLFCQLNRAVEGREDKRPQLADLRNSGDIEQVADVVQFLYREAYYLERSKEVAEGDPIAIGQLDICRNRLDVITQKSRTSRVGTTTLYIDVGASHIDGRRAG